MNKEKKVVGLIDTYNHGFTYNDYVDFCECNEIEADDENSNDYYEWLSEEISRQIEDFFDNLSYGSVDYPLLITGTLGLWDGKKTIYPVKMESSDWATKYKKHDGTYCDYTRPHFLNPSIKNAIKKCINGNSIEDFGVRFDNGIIEVDAMHHDGTNTFYIRKLSKRGLKKVEYYENNYIHDYKVEDWFFNKIKLDEIF